MAESFFTNPTINKEDIVVNEQILEEDKDKFYFCHQSVVALTKNMLIHFLPYKENRMCVCVRRICIVTQK